MIKVGIIGSGTVARSLGDGFLKYGYQVMLGTRDKTKLTDWVEGKEHAGIGSFEDTAAFGDIIVLAVKGRFSIDVLNAAGKENIAGKVIIDTGNPIDDNASPEDGVIKFYTGQNESLMEDLQAKFPESKFVKAFNSVGAALMVDPEFEDGKPTMFIAGDDEVAKETVSGILIKFGWEVEDMGTAKAARAIEPLCMLWCIQGFRTNHWYMAFKFLKK